MKAYVSFLSFQLNLMNVHSKKVKYQVEQVDVTKVDVLEKSKLLFIFIPNLIIHLSNMNKGKVFHDAMSSNLHLLLYDTEP